MFIDRATNIDHVGDSKSEQDRQGDRQGAPLQYTACIHSNASYIVRAHPGGRPFRPDRPGASGALLVVLPVLLLALLLAACGGTASSQQHIRDADADSGAGAAVAGEGGTGFERGEDAAWAA